MKYADVRLGHSDSKLHHVPPVPLHFHLQLSHQCRSQPYQVVVFDRLASAASSVSFQLAPLSASAFCWVVPVTPLLLPGQAETSMVAVWPPEPLAPLINHQDDYFARWLPHCMWGKKPDNCIIYTYVSHLMLVIWLWPIIIHDRKPIQIDSVSSVMLDT